MLRKYNGDVYSSTFVDEEIAAGKVNYTNGYKYEGTFENWFLQGKCTFDWNDGRHYMGEIFAGFPHGQGYSNDFNNNLIVIG